MYIYTLAYIYINPLIWVPQFQTNSYTLPRELGD